MSLFEYTVLNKEGKTIEGTMEAKDRFALYHAVKQDGSIVVSAKEIAEKKLGEGMHLPFLGGVKAHDKIIFAKNLSKMLEAGLPLTRGLSIMERQAKGKFKVVIIGLNDSLSKGNTFSDSMKK